MGKSHLSVSIVIPVYNEAAALGACLEAIQEQTQPPYEVIVVDNNSTDETADVASRFDFVKVIKEPRQGVIHARKLGFDLASGDIIGRIDADSIVPVDWVEKIQKVFADNNLDAVSGAALYYNVALAKIFNSIDLFFRRRLSSQLKDRVFLWGANMAIRRTAWKKVKPLVCSKAGIHEDYDIAIHLQELGGFVKFDENLKVQVSSRRIDVNFIDFMRYILVCPKTYSVHGVRRGLYLYEVIAVCSIGYLPARLLHRGFDPATGKFSLNKVFVPALEVRVDPTSNVV